MTAIAIFCDGTWNNKDRTEHDTSVARIFEAMEAEKKAGRRGIAPYYIEGVGADNEQQSLGKTIDRLRGGALGRGLTMNIREGYAHLCKTYKPGDKIYIFGFSRGAYTARSLAGLIRSAGLVRDADDINKAMGWYRNGERKTKPNTTDSQEFRALRSPDFHTNSAERSWRVQNGHPPGDPITIAYMGIFDTVGANGIPGILGQLGLIPGGHGFHDLDLSSMVQSGRHALGLDERRRLYRHTEWSNLDRLNRQAGTDARGGARYRQEWFPGDHGMIGGSGVQRQISNAVMAWILEGAEVAGLKVRLPSAVGARSDDYMGPISNRDAGSGWGKGWRKGPDRNMLAHVSDAALMRVRDVSDYRPKSLKLGNVSGWQVLATQQLSNNRIV